MAIPSLHSNSFVQTETAQAGLMMGEPLVRPALDREAGLVIAAQVISYRMICLHANQEMMHGDSLLLNDVDTETNALAKPAYVEQAANLCPWSTSIKGNERQHYFQRQPRCKSSCLRYTGWKGQK